MPRAILRTFVCPARCRRLPPGCPGWPSFRPARSQGTRALLAGFVALVPGALAAQQASGWPDPYPKTPAPGQPLTVGGYLERAFSDMLVQCGVGDLKAVVHMPGLFSKNAEVVRSAVPNQLRGAAALDLSAPVVTQDQRSLASLFAYVFRPSDVGAFPAFDPARFLALDVTVDPAAMLPQGSSTVVYNHSCTGVVSAALNANAGFRIPQASLEAAIKSEYNATQAAVLAVVAGTFASPLDAMLRSPDPADGLLARLTLWDWYRTQPGDAAAATGADVRTRPRYLTSMTGVALFTLQRVNRNTNAAVQLSAAGSLPFASLDARLRTALTSEDSLAIRTYATAAYQRPPAPGQPAAPQLAFDTLPQPAALVAYAAEHPAQLDPVYQRRLFAGQEHRHAQTVAGVPPAMCRTVLWTARARDRAPGVILASADTLPAQAEDNGAHRHACRFTVSFTPGAADLAPSGQRATTVTLAYDFVVVGAVAGTMLKVPAQSVELATSRSPELNPVQSSVAFRRDSAGGRTVGLSWPVALAVYDEDGALVDWTRIVSVNRPTVECAGSRRSVPITMQTTSDAAQRRLALAVSYPVTQDDPLDLAAPAESCRLSATLVFAMQAQAAGAGRPAVQARLVEQPLPQITVTFPAVRTPALAVSVAHTP